MGRTINVRVVVVRYSPAVCPYTEIGLYLNKLHHLILSISRIRTTVYGIDSRATLLHFLANKNAELAGGSQRYIRA